MKTIVGLDGKIVSKRDAKALIDLHVHFFGYGVFTTLRSYNGTLFRLREHTSRIMESAKIAGIKHKYRGREIEYLSQKVFDNSSMKDALVRIILSSGLKSAPARLFVFTDQLPKSDRQNHSQGAGAITVSAERFMPKAKTLSYFTDLHSHRLAVEADCAEAILLDRDGNATEGSRSNIFLVKNNEIITPKDGILQGVTRRDVIGLAASEFNLSERAVAKEELFGADEIFITSSIRGIIPIVMVDGEKIGTGKLGPVTSRIRKKFSEMIEHETKK